MESGESVLPEYPIRQGVREPGGLVRIPCGLSRLSNAKAHQTRRLPTGLSSPSH